MELHPKTFRYLTQLKRNNNRDWFEQHRGGYEDVKSSFEIFIGSLIAALTPKDQRLLGLEPKHCLFRIYRDVRFSNDKTPYKKHLSAAIGKGGRKSPLPGFYVHIEPNGETWLGGGIWRPEAPLLKKVRQEIDYNWDEYKRITATKAFKALFDKPYDDKITMLPKGYQKDNPAIEMLRYKSFVYGRTFKDADVMKPAFFKDVQKTYLALQPFFNFLYRAAEDD